jgi:hypothetical protein
MTRFQRTVVAGALLVGSGVFLFEYVPVGKVVWDGAVDVTVTVTKSGQPIRAVTCEAFGNRADAEVALEYLLPPETHMWSASANPFDGIPLTVTVLVSGLDSFSGRNVRRTQFQYLVVIARLQDGKRVGKIVEIPDVRVSRAIHVSLD